MCLHRQFLRKSKSELSVIERGSADVLHELQHLSSHLQPAFIRELHCIPLRVMMWLHIMKKCYVAAVQKTGGGPIIHMDATGGIIRLYATCITISIIHNLLLL